MFARLRAWLDARRKLRIERHTALRGSELAMHKATICFQKLHDSRPIGSHVLCANSKETIVRVMYMADCIPPRRAWFAVPQDGGEIRELSFDAVAELESPWR